MQTEVLLVQCEWNSTGNTIILNSRLSSKAKTANSRTSDIRKHNADADNTVVEEYETPYDAKLQCAKHARSVDYN